MKKEFKWTRDNIMNIYENYIQNKEIFINEFLINLKNHYNL